LIRCLIGIIIYYMTQPLSPAGGNSNMSKKLALMVFMALLFTFPGSVFSEGFRKPLYVPGEILVKFRSGAPKSSRNAAHSAHGFRLVQRFRRFQIDHVSIPEGWTVQEALTAYRVQDDVEYVEPNYHRYATATPNDPSFWRLWGLDKIECPEAWDTQQGDPNVVVAVVDSGADLDHEDLLNNIWQNRGEDWSGTTPGYNGIDDDNNGKIDDYYGWDFVNDDNDPDDDNANSYHGTHVSGTIGAEGNNGIGVSGLNWQASLMVLKILDENGDGFVANEIKAVEYAIDNGAHIINASFSGEGYSHNERNVLWDAGNAGILVVAAAGNDSRDHDLMPVYPSGYDLSNIISVGATDHDDVLASFSNYGAASVDIAAPGVSIYSTEAGDSYQYLSGTSMATPHVSGLAALIRAVNPGFTYGEVTDRILNGVDVVADLMGNVRMAGRINANNSLNPPADAPDTPEDLEAEAVSAAQIDLSWTDNASDESGFKIERATLSEGYRHVITLGPNEESYNDPGLSESTTYYYKVRAFNAAGDSEYSNEDDATTYLAAPGNLTATLVSNSWINLSWTDYSGAESGFRVERKLGPGGTYLEIATVWANVTAYSDTDLEPSTTYYYRVNAYDGSGNSEYSNDAHATTSAVSASSHGGGGDLVSSDSGNDVNIQPTGDSGGGGGCFIDSLIAGSDNDW
jgi:subtilisin family serine protease